MSCTPFIAVSRGINVDFTSTSALDPGYAIKIFTVVGAICGNCDTGNCLMESPPINSMMTEMTIAKTGLFINCLNIMFVDLGYSAYNSRWDKTSVGFTISVLIFSLFFTILIPSKSMVSFSERPLSTIKR